MLELTDPPRERVGVALELIFRRCQFRLYLGPNLIVIAGG